MTKAYFRQSLFHLEFSSCKSHDPPLGGVCVGLAVCFRPLL